MSETSRQVVARLLRQIKQELRITTSAAIYKLSLTSQWYQSGGGGCIIHATAQVTHPDLAEVAADMLRECFHRNFSDPATGYSDWQGQIPSLHELWRGPDGESLRKPLPKGLRNDRWEKEPKA